MVIESPTTVAVNPAVVRAARESARLTPRQAVPVLNRFLKRLKQPPVDETQLLSWESGERPTLEQAEALARAYLLPFAALFQEESPESHVLDFRLGPEGERRPLSYAAIEALDRFLGFYLAAREIAEGLHTLDEVIVPARPASTLRDEQDIEHFAAETRKIFGVSDELQQSWSSDAQALDAWRQAVEGLGVFVFSQPAPVSELRGASRWEPGGPPAILLNSNDGEAARIFTLIHEYTHLTFSREHADTVLCDPSSGGGPHEERLANRIAAAVIVPQDMLLQALPTPVPSADYRVWPSSVKSRIRKSVNASHAVIGIRLRQLGIVGDAGVQRYFWRQEGPRYGKRQPTWMSYRRYLGTRTIAYARRALDAEVLSVADLSRALGLKVDDLHKVLD